MRVWMGSGRCVGGRRGGGGGVGSGEDGVEGDVPLGSACALVDIDVRVRLGVPAARQRGGGLINGLTIWLPSPGGA